MEFDLIQKYFMRPSKNHKVILGNGDDCALIHTDKVLAVSADTLVEGTHFLENKITPADLGYRALAVNLSDLAAMGAKPVAFLLSLTLPKINELWLAEFSKGLLSWNIDLIGGNTTQGPLTINITIIGELPSGKALKRGAAKINDHIYVTGILGLAPVRPTPRVEFSQSLLDLAHAAIDISDGLTQDLTHILTASHLGAELELSKIPGTDFNRGEDYELCFTAPPCNEEKIRKLAEQTLTPLAKIGKVISKPGIWDKAGYAITVQGYQHFS